MTLSLTARNTISKPIRPNHSILIFLTNVNTSLKFFSKVNLEALRPHFCKRCKSNAKFHVHSKRPRKCVYTLKQWLSPSMIVIHRFKCSNCNKTIAIFPSFICKYGRIDLRYIEAFLILLDKGYTLNQAFLKIFKESHLSKRTIQRMKKSFTALIIKHSNAFLHFSITLNPLSPTYFSKSASLKDSLNQILKELTHNFPQFKMINLLGILKIFQYQNTILNFP